MLSLDEAANGRKRILGIDALTFRYVGRRGSARCSGFSTDDRGTANVGQRSKQFRSNLARQQRSDKSRLFELVNRLFGAVHQTLDRRISVEPCNLVTGIDGDFVGLLLDAPCPRRQARPVERPARLLFGDKVCDAGRDLTRKTRLANHNS